MKKIKSLFKRDYEGTHLVYNHVVEGCEWVLYGEGEATQKYDGTCCAVMNKILYKRFDRKLNKSAGKRKRAGHSGPWNIDDFKTAPVGWFEAQSWDAISGHWPGWLPVGYGPEDKYFNEALDAYADQFDELPPNGTYELIGEKVNGNNEQINGHILIKHGEVSISGIADCPRDFQGIMHWLSDKDIEGIVWYHPDGRMCKIKKSDFGLARKPILQPTK